MSHASIGLSYPAFDSRVSSGDSGGSQKWTLVIQLVTLLGKYFACP